MSKRVNLKQVAAHAGVSYQTVSKVINQKAQVSKATEERIWQSIHTLGYRPNLIARSLRSQRSQLIGYSWAPTPRDLVNPILDRFLQSMVEAAESAGYHILAFPFRPGLEWIEVYRELIDTNRVDGFVLSSIEFNDQRVQFLQERNFPFVAFGRSNPDWNFPYVDVDGGDGMRQVIEHLASHGHQRIAVLAWPTDSRVGQNRLEGVLSGFNACGIPFYEEYLVRGEGSYQFGYQAAQRFLGFPDPKRPSAIVAFNDPMAIGAMNAAQERGFRVGVDLAITGFDDVPMIQYLNPPLTSVRQPVWEIGQHIMVMLQRRLSGDAMDGEHILLSPRLIPRESSHLTIN